MYSLLLLSTINICTHLTQHRVSGFITVVTHQDYLRCETKFLSFFSWLHCVACGILVLLLGTCALCVGRQSLNHWTDSKVPVFKILTVLL